MPDIKITFQALRDKTQQLRDKNKQLDQILTDTKNAINSLEADWSSDTSITIRDKITGMQPTFDTYREVIESYAKFLDSAIAQYESTEATLNTNAAAVRPASAGPGGKPWSCLQDFPAGPGPWAALPKARE